MKLLLILFISIFLFSCSIQQEPSIDSHNPTAAEYNIRLGMGYFREGQVDRAREKLLRALQQAPNLPEVQLAMGYFLLELKQTDQAKPYYEKALKLAPDSLAVQNNFGVYLCRVGEYQKSISYFLKVAKNANYLHPDAAYENAGLCALEIPNKEQARHYFQEALRYNPLRKKSLLEIRRLKRYHGNHGKKTRTT